jgi:hypothetical protein
MTRDRHVRSVVFFGVGFLVPASSPKFSHTQELSFA